MTIGTWLCIIPIHKSTSKYLSRPHTYIFMLYGNNVCIHIIYGMKNINGKRERETPHPITNTMKTRKKNERKTLCERLMWLKNKIKSIQCICCIYMLLTSHVKLTKQFLPIHFFSLLIYTYIHVYCICFCLFGNITKTNECTIYYTFFLLVFNFDFIDWNHN